MKFNLTKSTRVIVAGRHEPEGIRTLASLYWSALLAGFFLIVIAVLIYGVLGLMRILNDLNGTGKVSTLPQSALDRAALDVTLRGFENRQSQFDLLTTTRGKTITDPSR